MNDAIFSQIDFGPLKEFLDDDNITDVSYGNGGQIHLKTLDKGVYRIEKPEINNALMEKLAFQCSNVMGKTFNMAQPFLDAESAELRLNFIHDSIATNGIACVIRKTPAKIRLNREKLLNEQYVTADLLDFLLTCVEGHCNIMVSGETGSGKTELVKYLASHTKENEKIITIEDTLELHLDKIFPHRDIVAMKTNNIASYSDVLVACMRQNPRWILLSEVRSAEAVTSVRNSISSGHNIISTIHSDRAINVPMRLYSLLESSQDIEQFLKSIHRYVQIAIHVKGYMSAELGRFQREIVEVCEFFVDDDNEAGSNVIYKKNLDGKIQFNNPTKYLREYLSSQGVALKEDLFVSNNENGNNPNNKVNETQDEIFGNNEENKEIVENVTSENTSTNENIEGVTNPVSEASEVVTNNTVVNSEASLNNEEIEMPAQINMNTGINETPITENVSVNNPVNQEPINNNVGNINPNEMSQPMDSL